MPYEVGAAGVVIYQEKEAVHEPAQLAKQLATVTGPYGRELLTAITECAKERCSGHGRCMPLPLPYTPDPVHCQCDARWSGAMCERRHGANYSLGKPEVKTDDVDNPLAGLPALPKIHHSDGMGGSRFTDSSSPLQQDFARITHAWAVAINAIYLDHTAAGVSIWNQSLVDTTLNKTEVIEATKLCAKVNASISVSYSPW